MPAAIPEVHGVPRRLSPPVVSGSGVSPSGSGPLSSVWRRTPFKAVDPVRFPELPESLGHHVEIESFRLHYGVMKVPGSLPVSSP